MIQVEPESDQTVCADCPMAQSLLLPVGTSSGGYDSFKLASEIDQLSNSAAGLLSGRLLAGNAVWNLVGLATPLVAAVIAVPELLAVMGTDRFGLLGIVWVVIGYFSLFDLGMGRALTKLVAERIGHPSDSETAGLVWTAMVVLLGISILTAGLVFAVSEVAVRRILNVPAELIPEGARALRLLAIGIPFVVLNSALVGLLEAYQRFRLIAAIRVPMGIWTFLGPMLMVQFSESLVWATAALVLGRAVFAFFYFASARKVVAALRSPVAPDRRSFESLLSLGGWLFVSNIVGPLMVYCDRIVIASMVTMTAVAYYITPFEMVTRLSILPQALIGVIFPAIALAVRSDPIRLVRIARAATFLITAGMLPIAAGIFLFAPEALGIWLGADFRIHSTPVARFLALGLLLNAVARLPLVILQASGRPDLAAKLHLAELVPYLFLLWLLIDRFGINGAAIAWLVRVLVDTCAMILMARQRVGSLNQILTYTLCFVIASIVLFAILAWLESPLGKAALLAAMFAGCTIFLKSSFGRLSEER